MINISKQLERYFILISIISIAFITVVSNLSMNVFFIGYVWESRERDDLEMVKYIEELYAENQGLDAQSLMSIMHYAHGLSIEVRIKDMNNKLIWTSGLPTAIPHGMIEGDDYKNSNRYAYKNYPFTHSDKQVGIIEIGRLKSIFVVAEDRKFVYTINGVYLAAAIFSIILAAVLSLHASRKFLNPIYLIKENAKLIEYGKFKQLKDIDTNTQELQELSDSIKELAEKLEYQDLLRKRMTSDIAHELRTPLATLQSYIEAFIDRVWEPTPERLTIIRDEITRLTKLIKDIEDLSVIESEEVKLNMENVNLSALINNVAESFRQLLAGKNIELVKKIQENVEMMGDADRLNQIFINLISNAYKYTNEHGTVTVKLSEQKNEIKFSVEDTGIGIRKEDLPYIFERFYRGDASRSRKTGGTGIGLTITKALVEAHKGRIEIDSEEGKGTKVYIYFHKSP